MEERSPAPEVSWNIGMLTSFPFATPTGSEAASRTPTVQRGHAEPPAGADGGGASSGGSSQIESTMRRLEANILTRLGAMQRDIADLKQQQQQQQHLQQQQQQRQQQHNHHPNHQLQAQPSRTSTTFAGGPRCSDVGVNSEEAQDAQQQLEYTLRTVYEQFAKFDADGSGALEPKEVREALNSIGTVDGHTVSDEDIADVMRRYDGDGNGALDADEFLSFVRDLVLDGKFEFKEELQQAIEKIAMATKEVRPDHRAPHTVASPCPVRSLALRPA